MSPLRPRIVFAVLAAVTAPTPVFAQTAPPPPPAAPARPVPAPPAAAARALTPAAEVAAADKALRVKDWAGALAHDQAAIQAGLDPKLQLHAQLGAAEALFQLGRAPEAYEAYDDIQHTAGPKLVGGERAVVAARLKDLATKTGALSLHVEEPGADVQLDGKPLGTSPLALLTRVAAGGHEVHVTKAGFVPFASHVDVAPDVKAAVDVTLVRAATTGHVMVQTPPGGEPLRVIVDGVDRGATPWEGDLPAGAHEISGRSSSATVAPQGVMVGAGEREQVTLVSTATAAHVQIRTSDGKGLVYLDSVVKGEGAFEGDVAPGPHTIVVTREGYERYEKPVTLGPRETMAETVTLHPTAAAAAAAGPAAERAYQGVYGGFGFTALFGVTGQGTDLETSCQNLGAASCDTPKPFGGGLYGYVGYTWDPVGFELYLAGEGDTTQQTAHFDGTATQFSSLVGKEQFTYIRGGGLAALRVRASASFGPLLRGTIAGGVGLSIKEMVMARQATASGTTGRDLYAPSPAQYVSPAITVEAALQLRATPTIAFSFGLLLWADNASITGSNDVPATSSRSLYATSGLPKPIETPLYHLATGPQVFLGPQLGMQFGP